MSYKNSSLNPYKVDENWKKKGNSQSVKGRKTSCRGQRSLCVTLCLTWLNNKDTIPSLILCSFSRPSSRPPPLLCLLPLSEGFLMTNLSGLASLPISHCGIQLPPHPLMNSLGSKDRADRGEDRWKTHKSASPPSFTFQDSTPPASSQAGSFSSLLAPF